MSSFAVLILTNARPDRQDTIKTLRKDGYTGPIVLVLDDMDPTVDQYKELHPECQVYVFNKLEAIELTDSADNTGNPRAVVYARNMAFRIAHELGFESFLVLDDDYTNLMTTSNSSGGFKRKEALNLDRVFAAYVEFLKSTPADTIAFSQGGDFIGGSECRYAKNVMLTRKAMNSFFCLTERPFQFYGLINEDVNMYVLNGSRGKLCFTSTLMQLNQRMTQSNAGGLTTIYLELGTYSKSFYSVMYHPSSVTIKEMGRYSKRIHHSIDADHTYPKILRPIGGMPVSLTKQGAQQ